MMTTDLKFLNVTPYTANRTLTTEPKLIGIGSSTIKFTYLGYYTEPGKTLYVFTTDPEQLSGRVGEHGISFEPPFSARCHDTWVIEVQGEDVHGHITMRLGTADEVGKSKGITFSRGLGDHR
jgi:hypothetical protein